MKTKLFRYYYLVFGVLLISGMAAAYLSLRDASPQTMARKIQGRVHDELSSIESSAQQILESVKTAKGNWPATDDADFFVYKKGLLERWTGNLFVPTARDIEGDFHIKLMKVRNGDYLLLKWDAGKQTILVGVLPLYTDYHIRNDYLKPIWNSNVFPHGGVNILEAGSPIGLAIQLEGNTLFKIDGPVNDYLMHEKNRLTATILLFLAALFFCISTYHSIRPIRQKYPTIGFGILLAAALAVRGVMALTDFPTNLIHTRVFDPKYFASSVYNASLGELLINETLLVALCFYLFQYRDKIRIDVPVNLRNATSVIVPILETLAIAYAALFPFVVTQTLYNNSTIPIDISQSLHFDWLRILSLIAVLMSWVCAFLVSHVFVERLFQRHWKLIILGLLFGTSVFCLFSWYTNQLFWPTLVSGLLFGLLVYFLRLYKGITRIGYATFAYLFVAVFCFAINGALCINYFSRHDQLERQFRFASNFLIDRDNFGEYLLHETANKIKQDRFVRIRMNSPLFNRDAIRQKIRQYFLPSYLAKYEVEIYLFNATGSPLNNHSAQSFSDLIGNYNSNAYDTDFKEVHFINSPSADVTHKYLVIVPVARGRATTGYVVIELSLKKVIPDNVYPELLVDSRFQQLYKTRDLSFAVLSNKGVVFSSGDFNYEGRFRKEWLGKTDLYRSGIEASGFLHVAQEDEIGRAAVVSSQLPSLSIRFANFSFLLVCGLAIILLLFISLGLINYTRGEKLFFAARIQLVLNLAFFFPLMVASVTTLQLNTESSKKQIDDDYLNKTEVFADQLSIDLDNSINHTDQNLLDFDSKLTSLAKVVNLDANIFSSDGILLSTSQPQIIDNGLLSIYVNPVALKKVHAGETLFIEKERIGLLDYFVSYAALKSPPTGKLIGILAIPFFQSAYSLQSLQITIVSNILNIFASIFIVVLLLSYVASSWLTFPLKFITRSLSKTSLTKVNEPLKWNAQDEIGLMVQEYNQMLFKLSESKAELEQTQRERAWREIAQQVAHEIKNPLTPMKLSLQQLERSIESGSNNPEKTEKAVKSLLGQVDTLNDIASSFSSFARMPEPVVQRLEIISLVKRIIDLHNVHNELHFSSSQKELFVAGDDQLLGRTFSNIILNAQQAVHPDRKIRVDVSVKIWEGKCLVVFKDNGVGIDDAHREKVFTPHFSTKRSGSGIGLAIARQGIEQLKGRIWFETKPTEGTSFFIELILHEI